MTDVYNLLSFLLKREESSMEKHKDYLKSPDLLPTSIEKRTIGSFGFVIVWIGMAVVLAAFTLGGQVSNSYH